MRAKNKKTKIIRNHPTINRERPSPVLFLAAKHASNVATSALGSISDRASGLLCVLCDRLGYAVEWSRSPLPILALSAPFSAVDALLARPVTDGLRKTTFSNLSADEAVHSVLESINLLNPSDLALVKSVYLIR
jgi:hypothetical protein